MERLTLDEASLTIKTAPNIVSRSAYANMSERNNYIGGENSIESSTGQIAQSMRFLTSPMTLALSTSAPKLNELDLTKCPKVLEEGWYNINAQINNCPTHLVEKASVYVNGGYLGDISIDNGSPFFKGVLVFSATSNSRGSLNGQPFLLLFDSVVLSLVIELSDNSSFEFYSRFLICVSKNKTDTENIGYMIKELSEFDDYQISKWLFESNVSEGKRNLLESNLDNYAYRSMSSYIELLEEISRCYHSNFPYFRSMGKHSLQKKGVLVPYNNVKSIDEQSFNWLMQNADQLSQVPSGGFKYNNKYYLPLKIHSQVNSKSYDIYENQIVVGFLFTVLNHAQLTFSEFENQVSEQEQKLQLSRNSLPDEYCVPALSGSSVYVDYCRSSLLLRLGEAIKSMVSLYRQYLSLFTVSVHSLNALPRKSKIFQEIKPYTHVFAMIIKWFEYGNFNLEKDKLLLQVQTLDRLFEFYCLIALIKLLSEHGYVMEDDSSSVFHYKYEVNDGLYADEVNLPNTFIMHKDNITATLYYQPVISSEEFFNGMKLFRTTATFKQGGDYYTPDFVLKFEDGQGRENYLIFDAKFSSHGSIVNNHLQEVIRKYSQEMAVAHEDRAPKMVWILQGRSSRNPNPIWRLGNSKLAQRYEQATSYGIFTLTPLTSAQNGLWSIISKAIPWA